MAPPLSWPSSYGAALLLQFLPIVDAADVDGGSKDDGLAAVEGGLCGVARNDDQHTKASSPTVPLLPPLLDPASGQRHHTRPKMVVEGDGAPSEGEGSANRSSRRNSKRPTERQSCCVDIDGRQRMMRLVTNFAL